MRHFPWAERKLTSSDEASMPEGKRRGERRHVWRHEGQSSMITWPRSTGMDGRGGGAQLLATFPRLEGCRAGGRRGEGTGRNSGGSSTGRGGTEATSGLWVEAVGRVADRKREMVGLVEVRTCEMPESGKMAVGWRERETRAWWLAWYRTKGLVDDGGGRMEVDVLSARKGLAVDGCHGWRREPVGVVVDGGGWRVGCRAWWFDGRLVVSDSFGNRVQGVRRNRGLRKEEEQGREEEEIRRRRRREEEEEYKKKEKEKEKRRRRIKEEEEEGVGEEETGERKKNRDERSREG